MNKIPSLRCISPALIDYCSLSCRTLRISAQRFLHAGCVSRSEDNKNYKVNPLFENRNPRCLETMGLAPKRKGWKFQAPRRDYYHKLTYEVSHAHTYARVEHCSGKTIIDASTMEKELARHLYSLNDVSASRNVGRVLAHRMLEAGITSVFFEADPDDVDSEKAQAFLSALQDSHIQLSEPEEVNEEQIPGINYDGYHRCGEERKYQDDYQKL